MASVSLVPKDSTFAATVWTSDTTNTPDRCTQFHASFVFQPPAAFCRRIDRQFWRRQIFSVSWIIPVKSRDPASGGTSDQRSIRRGTSFRLGSMCSCARLSTGCCDWCTRLLLLLTGMKLVHIIFITLSYIAWMLSSDRWVNWRLRWVNQLHRDETILYSLRIVFASAADRVCAQIESRWRRVWRNRKRAVGCIVAGSWNNMAGEVSNNLQRVIWWLLETYLHDDQHVLECWWLTKACWQGNTYFAYWQTYFE